MVVAEETITPFQHFNNDASPMWTFGSRTIARLNDTVFAMVPEVGADARPYCNTRWVLYRRPDGGRWERVQASPIFDEREPCPLALLPGRRLILSVNPAREHTYTMDNGSWGFRYEPGLLQFSTDDLHNQPMPVHLPWDRAYDFSAHTYRALAADPVAGTMLLTTQVPVNDDFKHAYLFFDANGQVVRQGLLHFPMRGCYQQVAVCGNTVYVMAVSDEKEPNPVWRAYKREQTGQSWDYDFRQLFFTWTPDITTTEFSPPLTFFSRDDTAGHLLNLDLALNAEGDAHLLFRDRNIWHPCMRDRFFPDTPITVALKYARVRNGRVIDRQTLLEAAETPAPETQQARTVEEMPDGQLYALWSHHGLRMRSPVPEYGTFHATPDGRLFVIWYQSGPEAGNYIRQIQPASSPPQRLPLDKPLTQFYAACPRNGCLPSHTIDLYGVPEDELLVRYVQVLFPPVTATADTG